MAGEVSATGAPAQATRTRSAELEQNQAAREAVQPSRNEGVEVRISREAAQRTDNPDITYENLRPRGGAAPEAEAQPVAESERQVQAEAVDSEESGAREAARRESANDSQQAGR